MAPRPRPPLWPEREEGLSISQELRNLARRVGERVALPRVRSLLLPQPARELGKQDEFGFVVLEDGSSGPFYVSLAQTLTRLYPLQRRVQGADTLALTTALGGADLARSALALGALNALSQHLMRRAGFDPTVFSRQKDGQGAGRLGMVGYFPPLAERYRAQGIELVVIEKNPSRVPDDPGIRLGTRPSALADCDRVICTASALINDSLDEVLAALAPAATLALTGPSASCLPDPLFDAGVTTIGGIRIEHPEELAAALQSGGSWSEYGSKYQMGVADYPGVERLLAAC